MYSGSLTFKDYNNLYKNKLIEGINFNKNQIQPSSIDLTLSEECYEISYSFLSPNRSVREKLREVKLKKINLSKKYIFKKNKTFIVRINEKLNLTSNIFGLCNPKSSTGRLDIFCRCIVDKSDAYEKIPKNYKGEVFIEITSRSFDVKFQKGDSLNQMRLIKNKHLYVSDNQLKKIHSSSFLTLDNNNKKIIPKISNGLRVSVDLSKKNIINGYIAKLKTPILHFNKVGFHKIQDFWEPIKCKNEILIIKKNRFYILKSKEKVQIPKNMAGEMIPYDTSLGDFRAHYAGFFDPGFGKLIGSYAVLEVKTNEVPFLLEDGQSIARIKYEMLNRNSDKLYGANINSNYQHQGLALSKHFV